MRVRLFTVLLAVAACAPFTPAHTLPISPPSVDIVVEPTADPLTYFFHATAGDPDGPIYSVKLCIEDGDASECLTSAFESASEPDLSCALGSTAESPTRPHTFGAYGSYQITAEVRAGGCPVLGADESASDYEVLEVFPLPPADPIEIACAVHGDPASTDVGVTESEIKLGAVASLSGFGSASGHAAATAMRAVVRAVNEGGGVCGRSLALEIADDGGDATRGRVYASNMARAKFALAVMPSDATLRQAITSGSIGDAGIPVVGTLGRVDAEFGDPLVWPVGASARSFAHVAVGHPYDRGARRFGIVYDNSSTRHVEHAEALRDRIESMPDAVLAAYVGVYPARAAYSAEIQQFNTACAGCDVVYLELDPQTALTWIAGRPDMGSTETVGSRALFTAGFASNCGSRCDRMVLWSDVEKPLGPFSDDTRQYVQAMREADPAADIYDPDGEGAYLGMLLLATQLGRTGVDLTRARYSEVLDSAGFGSGLIGNELEYAARRDGNHSLRAYSIVYKGAFAGWRQETGWVTAP